jgi:hypothetical protein
VSAQASLTGLLGRVAGETVGTYALNLGSLANSNYTITLSGTPVNFTINKLAVTVTADNKTKLSTTTADPTFTWTSTPALASTALTGTLTRTNTSNAAGVYAITQGTLTNTANPNYSITFVQGSLTIVAPTPLSASVVAQNGTVSQTSGIWTTKSGTKLTVAVSGGGTGALTWTVSTGSCSIDDVVAGVVDMTQKQISTNGKGSCTVTISRAADASYAASSINVALVWD